MKPTTGDKLKAEASCTLTIAGAYLCTYDRSPNDQRLNHTRRSSKMSSTNVESRSRQALASTVNASPSWLSLTSFSLLTERPSRRLRRESQAQEHPANTIPCSFPPPEPTSHNYAAQSVLEPTFTTVFCPLSYSTRPQIHALTLISTAMTTRLQAATTHGFVSRIMIACQSSGA